MNKPDKKRKGLGHDEFGHDHAFHADAGHLDNEPKPQFQVLDGVMTWMGDGTEPEGHGFITRGTMHKDALKQAKAEKDAQKAADAQKDAEKQAATKKRLADKKAKDEKKHVEGN